MKNEENEKNELQEWKDLSAKLVNITNYALNEFSVVLTEEQTREVKKTMQHYHELRKSENTQENTPDLPFFNGMEWKKKLALFTIP